jgi:hypothetical protein
MRCPFMLECCPRPPIQAAQEPKWRYHWSVDIQTMQQPNELQASPQPTVKDRPRRRLWLLIFPFFAISTVLMVIAALYPLLHSPHQRERLNETSSADQLRTLQSLQNKYAATHPKQGFACGLASLKSAQDTPSAALENFLSTGTEYGYQFAISNCSTDANGIVQHYQATAVPAEPGTTAFRAFCSDDSGALWFSPAGSAADCLASRRPVQ